MARVANLPLNPDVHAKALAKAREVGRERAAKQFGIGTATLERALAFASLTPLVRRAIEQGVAGSSVPSTQEARQG